MIKVAENPEPLISLMKRMTPGLEDAFEIEFIPYWNHKPDKGSYFEIETRWNNKIQLKAHTLRDMIAAYGWYIKNMAGFHFSRLGNRIDLSKPLPRPSAKITRSSPWAFRFAYNYCALSYTMPFYTWENWERELDFMAMNGFTHILVTAGLEKVWHQTLLEGGYPEEKIKKYIASPLYSAWWHLGNLEGFGGPLTPEFMDREAELGVKIANRIRELDMIPVFLGFMGLVPHDLDQYVEEVKLVQQGKWVGDFQRPALLFPQSQAFMQWAGLWYKHLHELYGITSAYAGDLFHEGGCFEGLDLKKVAQQIQQAMQKASPGSRWFLQGWRDNPLPELVSGLHKEQSLILELWKDMSVCQMNKDSLRTFRGHPWIWSEVTNFGGNHDLYGGLPLMAQLPSWLLYHPGREHICGLGMLSEGVDTNPVQYDLFYDLFWEKENIDIKKWLNKYVERRYGKLDPDIREAFSLLEHSVYNAVSQQEGSTECLFCARPSLITTKVSYWASDRVYYQPLHVIRAVSFFLKAAPQMSSLETYRYDLTDFVRQMLADAARPLLIEIAVAFKKKDENTFHENVAVFLQIFDDMQKLLASNEFWLLGSWLQAAREKGKTASEKELMETMARRLITTWSGKEDLLDEYSNRQWAGLIVDYYKPRWEAFFDACRKVMHTGNTGVELTGWYIKMWEKKDIDFEKQRKNYNTQPSGDTVAIAEELFRKYVKMATALWEKHQDLVNIQNMEYADQKLK